MHFDLQYYSKKTKNAVPRDPFGHIVELFRGSTRFVCFLTEYNSGGSSDLQNIDILVTAESNQRF